MFDSKGRKIHYLRPVSYTHLDVYKRQAPGAESVRMPDGTERTLAAEHAAAILVNEQPAFRVVCTPELLSLIHI